ncbi:MAG: chemotaxis protein CheW [Gemmatimonadota bacterium]
MSAHLLARVGDERFAFALGRVLEAVDAPTVHDLPLRPGGMLGTLRHRGQTLPLWDAGSAFGVRRLQAEGTALVFRDAGRGVALLVDDAVGIVQIPDDALRAAPPGSDGEGLLAGVVRDEDGLLSVVRVDVLVSRLVLHGARRGE